MVARKQRGVRGRGQGSPKDMANLLAYITFQ